MILDTYCDESVDTTFYSLSKDGDFRGHIYPEGSEGGVTQGTNLLNFTIIDKGLQLGLLQIPDRSEVRYTTKSLGKEGKTLAYIVVSNAKVKKCIDTYEKTPILILEDAETSLEIDFKIKEDILEVHVKDLEASI